jgi:energy-coupling factor transport system permease protein
MTEALGLYVPGNSRVHQLHPLTKLAFVGFVLLGGLALPGAWTTYALLFLVVMPLARWGRVLGKLIAATWRVALPFAVSVFLIQGFLWPNGTPLVGIGLISLKREGLVFAVASTGRILTVVSSFLWFAFTTRPDALMAALAQQGVPASLTYILLATLQIVPRFRARAAAIIDAQRARGLETGGSLFHRAQGILPLVVPLILSSLIDVEERALAIEARAFNHPGLKTSLIEIAQSAWEPAARWAAVLGAIGFLLFRLWFSLHP